MPVTFLVVDGYSLKARNDMKKNGAPLGGETYANAIRESMPNCNIDIVFAADPDTRLDQFRQLKDYTGSVWTGSSLMVDDDTSEVHRQISLMGELFKNAVPIFGSCWALQIAAIASGGSVKRVTAGPEFGIARRISLTRAGRAHPMYAGIPDIFENFTIHRDEVDGLPPSSLILATNSHTRVQSAQITHLNSSFWGVQYHPEFDFGYMYNLTLRRKDNLVRDGFFHTEQDCMNWAQHFTNLDQNPDSKPDLWALGLDKHLFNPSGRMREFRNWARHILATDHIFKYL